MEDLKAEWSFSTSNSMSTFQHSISLDPSSPKPATDLTITKLNKWVTNVQSKFEKKNSKQFTPRTVALALPSVLWHCLARECRC
jgi:hypothetical protein